MFASTQWFKCRRVLLSGATGTRGESVTYETSCWSRLRDPARVGTVWSDFRTRLQIFSSSPPACLHQSCPRNGKVLEGSRIRYYIRPDTILTFISFQIHVKQNNKETRFEIWPPRQGGNPSPNTAPMSPSRGPFKIPSCKHITASLTNRETSLYCTSESDELWR